MKDSGIEWIGEIPEEWEVNKFKYIMHKEKRICAIYRNQDILSLTMRGVIKRDLDNPEGKMPESFNGYQYISDGKLLLCLFDIDVTPCCVGVIKNEGLTSPAYSQFILDSSNNLNYYYYLLKMLDYDKVFVHLSKNLRHSLTESDFGQVLAITPPIKEQQAISDFLDDKVGQIDGILSDLNKEIDILNKYKKSLITETVTKGLDPNVKMKDSEIDWIGEIPEEWSVKPLKYLTKLIIDGTHNTPTYVDDGIPFLRVTDITSDDGIDKTIKFDSVAKIPKEEHQNLIKRCKPEVGDLLVSKNGTIGVPKIVDWNWEFSIFVSLCLIKTKDNLLVKWLYYYFKSELIDIEIAYGGKKNTIVNLHLEKIENFRIPLPPLAEQQQIANYLDKKCTEINSAISDKQKQIETMEKLKKSLIYEYVTGKKRVGGELKCQEISLESEKTFSSIL